MHFVQLLEKFSFESLKAAYDILKNLLRYWTTKNGNGEVSAACLGIFLEEWTWRVSRDERNSEIQQTNAECQKWLLYLLDRIGESNEWKIRASCCPGAYGLLAVSQPQEFVGKTWQCCTGGPWGKRAGGRKGEIGGNKTTGKELPNGKGETNASDKVYHYIREEGVSRLASRPRWRSLIDLLYPSVYSSSLS